MAIAYVNGGSASHLTGTNITSLSASAFNAVAGNTIVVGFRASDGVSVTDTAGNTYTRVVNAYPATNIGTMSMFYATNITGNANNVVTATFNAGGYQEMCVAQYSGVSKTSPLDVGGSINNSAVTNNITSPSFTTTSANELLICFATVANSTATFTAGSGYTLRNNSVASTLQEKIVSSIQTGVTASISANVTFGFGITVMTLKEEPLVLTSNLISYYKLDEASGNAADSVGSNTGVNTNVTYAAGKINNGAVFNSTTDKLTLPTIITQGSDHTISAWVYRNTNGVNSYIFDQRRNSDGYPLITFSVNTNNKPIIQYRDSNLSNYTAFEGTNTVSNNSWHHFVITKSGTTITHYLDGSSNGSTTNSAVWSGCDIAWIGQVYGGGSNSDCIIDEVGVWSRALSSTEITTLYNAGTGITYPFGDNTSAFFNFI